MIKTAHTSSYYEEKELYSVLYLYGYLIFI